MSLVETTSPEFRLYQQSPNHNAPWRQDIGKGVQEQHDRLAHHYNDYIEDHDRHERILRYCGSGSYAMNAAMRRHHLGVDAAPNDNYFLDLGHQMRDDIKRHAYSAPEEIHTYSGIGGGLHDHLLNLGQGGTFHSPNFISSSIHPYTPMGFSYNVAHFKIPEGSRAGLYVGGFSPVEHEQEFIVNAGTKWKHTGTSRFTRPGYFSTEELTHFVHHLEPDQ